VVRAAAAHLAPVFMDTDATVDKVVEWVRRAGAEGVDLLVFPEAFVPGYPYWIECYPPLDQVAANAKYISASIEVAGPEIARVQAAAREAGVVVSLGISERALGGSTCFNSMVTIDADGTVRGVHRKLQPTYAERYIWGQGDGSTLSVYDTQVGRLGGLACWEHTMNLARQALIVQGIQIHAGAWPGLSTMAGFLDVADAQIEAMMKRQALTAQCFVVTASNPVDQGCLDWMERELGPQKHVGLAGGDPPVRELPGRPAHRAGGETRRRRPGPWTWTWTRSPASRSGWTPPGTTRAQRSCGCWWTPSPSGTPRGRRRRWARPASRCRAMRWPHDAEDFQDLRAVHTVGTL
jgi:nitrilase